MTPVERSLQIDNNQLRGQNELLKAELEDVKLRLRLMEHAYGTSKAYDGTRYGSPKRMEMEAPWVNTLSVPLMGEAEWSYDLAAAGYRVVARTIRDNQSSHLSYFCTDAVIASAYDRASLLHILSAEANALIVDFLHREGRV